MQVLQTLYLKIMRHESSDSVKYNVFLQAALFSIISWYPER